MGVVGRVVAAWLTFTSGVLADEPSFTWDAPAGCPSSADVASRVARRLRNPRRGSEARAHVTTHVDGVNVKVTIGDAERTLSAPTCEEAADAVAVIVALALDEGASPTAEAPKPAPPPESPKTRWAAGLLGGIDAGSLPRVSPGAGASIELRRGAVAGRGVVSGFLPQTERSAEPPVDAVIGLFDATLSACVLGPVVSVVDVGVCGGGGIGLLRGESQRVSNPGSGYGLRFEGVASGRLDVSLSESMGIHADVGTVIDPVRSPFRVGGIGDVFRPPAFAVRATIGVEVRLR